MRESKEGDQDDWTDNTEEFPQKNMMKNIRICSILFLIPFFAFSYEVKEPPDSVLIIHRIDSLNNLASLYLQKENFQKVLEYNFMIADDYSRLGDTENIINSYIKIIGVCVKIKAYDLAEKYLQVLEEITKTTTNPVSKAWIFSNQAQISLGKGKTDLAIRNFYLAIFYFQKGNLPWHEGRAYRLLGDALLEKNLYKKAFYSYKASTLFFQQIPDDFEVAVNYTRIAHIYQIINDNRQNLEYNLRALHIRERLGTQKMINNSYLNVGEAYWLIGQKDSARFYMDLALKLAKQNKNTYLIAIIYDELSGFAKEEKKFKDALKYYDASIDNHRQFNAEQNDAQIGLMAANHSIRAAEAVNALMRQENQIQDLQFKHRRLKTILYECVFIFLMGLIVFINTMNRTNRKRKNRLLSLNTQLKAEIQDRIEAEGRLHRSEALYRFLAENTIDVISLLDSNMKRLFISPSCEKFYGFTPFEILRMNSPLDLVEPSHRVTVNYHLLELFRTKKTVQYRYKALRKDGSSFWAESNINPIFDPETGAISEMITTVRNISQQIIHEEDLAENERQKDFLLREIHNRVKNNFAILISLMNMQQDQTGDMELNRSIADLQLRVRTMSLVHEHLYRAQDISAIPFDDYLLNLILIIASSYKNDRIKVVTDIRSCKISIELALPMGLIVNELITNAYKYAFPGNNTGTIWVKLLEESDGKYSITIRDDGIGLPENFSMKKPQSMGTQIVQILVEQVDAQLEFTVNGGTSFRILFSIQQEK